MILLLPPAGDCSPSTRAGVVDQAVRAFIRRHGRRPRAIWFAPTTYATLAPYLTYNRWVGELKHILTVTDASLAPETVVLSDDLMVAKSEASSFR